MTLRNRDQGTLGARLSSIRSDRGGMSQKQLAKRAGVSTAIIASIEQGRKQNPTLRTLYRLCNALDISIGELTAGLDESLKQNSGSAQ